MLSSNPFVSVRCGGPTRDAPANRSVDELLADSRDQIASVIAAINAQQQFWLADAALSSSLIGKPITAMAPTPVSTSTGEAEH